MWLTRSVISIRAGKSKSMRQSLNVDLFMFLEALLCVYSLLINPNGRMHPKVLINDLDLNLPEIHTVSVNLYWIMHYLIWPFVFHRPLHFSTIDSTIGSLLSPIFWDWLKKNRGETSHCSHILSITGYTDNSVSSLTTLIDIKNIFRYGFLMPLLKFIDSIVYVEGKQKSICLRDI